MKKLIIMFLTPFLLAGCGIYKPYSRPKVETDALYRNIPVADTVSLASLSWRELFTDPALQKLIEEALAQNTDLRIAYLRVDEAKAALQSARLAYLPAVGLNAEGGISRFKDSDAKTYSIGMNASWEVDVFGKLTASKRQAFAALEETGAYRQAVQTQLIATMADSYYSLLMLDEQLRINKKTCDNWTQTVRVLDALKRNGKTNEAAVLQARANLLALENAGTALRNSISRTENALSALLAAPSHTIERGNLDSQLFPDSISVGLPVQLLANRPDVRQAEFNLAKAYYATHVTRSAFYPSINLSGVLGWTNNGGGVVVNPGGWLANAIGSIVQPLFNKGINKANLKIAKANQEEALLLFRQSILDAGQEVNDALTQWQTAGQRIDKSTVQIKLLEEAVRKTQLLMLHSDGNYLEILTAQQTLLDAQQSLTQDRFDKIQGIIRLYHALGGGA